MIAIRPASPADLEFLHGIESQAFDGDRISRRSFKQLIQSPSAHIFVCERYARPVGYAVVLFRKNSRSARLYSIAVSSNFAGEGLGTVLLTAAERFAAERHMESIRLEVRADNDRAIRLYCGVGYRLAGIKERYYEDGAAAYRLAKAFHMAASRAPAGLAGCSGSSHVLQSVEA